MRRVFHISTSNLTPPPDPLPIYRHLRYTPLHCLGGSKTDRRFGSLDVPSRTTFAHAASVSPCSLGTVVAARATGKEQRPLPCGSHSRRRAKQIDRAACRMCPATGIATGITLISLSQNELRPTQPGFVLAAGSRLTPLVPALDSPKLSTPTVLVSARSVIQPRAGLIAMGSSSPQPSMSACIYLHCSHLGRFHLPSRWSSQKSRTQVKWPRRPREAE